MASVIRQAVQAALEGSLEEVPGRVLLLCLFVCVFACKVWHAEYVFRMRVVGQEFDCDGWQEAFGLLVQISRL